VSWIALRCIRYHLKSFPRDILILNGGCEVACQRNDSEKSTIYHRIAEHTSLLSLTDGVQDEVMEILGKRNRYCVDWLGLSEQAKKQSRDATKVHAQSQITRLAICNKLRDNHLIATYSY
jgi:hypothetical protein